MFHTFNVYEIKFHEFRREKVETMDNCVSQRLDFI